ncbi:MAG: CBS domain-containing protein [Candidatus Rokubacteria bacterium]|nr:CBS domain-containing protein [Candidatus Rokubacteria bacterium]MBI2879247.1 CBS domain-containing protein [Candidatus Rokubacteria bacterium]
MAEFLDEYSESLEREFRKLEEALLSETVSLLAPSLPIKLTVEATVEEAIGQMLANRRAAVVIVNPEGRLIGIFTERDVLTRVVGAGRDPRATRLGEVMTPDPEALAPNDRICYAINRMNNAGYRTVPLVDSEHRPIGVVTVKDVVKWLAEIFPEAVLNLRPGDRLKRPTEVDGG